MLILENLKIILQCDEGDEHEILLNHTQQCAIQRALGKRFFKKIICEIMA